MMSSNPYEVTLPAEALMTVEGLPFPRIATGKVREIFDSGEYYLMVASDRISAYDVVMPNGIPGKGSVLTQISLFWFDQCKDWLPNHLAPDHGNALKELLKDHQHLIPRSMLVQKLQPLPVEAIIRGYLSGSGWNDYRDTGKLFGQTVPEGLRQSDQLPEALFTPTTKAQTGHDEAITLQQCEEILGSDTYHQVVQNSLKLYKMGHDHARQRGIILADTKFEFGKDADGKLYLIDEALTPDSSRFWPADQYEPGKSPPSFDKQFVRDYLSTLDWDKTPPGPELPQEVLNGTSERYSTALKVITGG